MREQKYDFPIRMTCEILLETFDWLKTDKSEYDNCLTEGNCGLRCGETLRKHSIFRESLYINME